MNDNNLNPDSYSNPSSVFSYVFSSRDSSNEVIKLNEFGQSNEDNSVSSITGTAQVSYIDSFIGVTEFKLLYTANATAYNVTLSTFLD